MGAAFVRFCTRRAGGEAKKNPLISRRLNQIKGDMRLREALKLHGEKGAV